MGAEKGWPFVAETPSPACLAERTWPRVTLVTPSYQQGDYLEETILSVLNQGYPNLEYIVMDGGSSDGSVEIIKKYASRLAGWESKQDRGQSHAINKGWRNATGEFLWWINADDVLTPLSLFRSVSYLMDHPSFGAVYGDLAIIDSCGEKVGVQKYHLFSYQAVLEFGYDISQPGALMRRSCIEQVGFLNEELHLVMDLDYWHRLALEGIRIAHLPEILALFRVYDDTKTQSSPTHLIQERYYVARSILNHRRFLDEFMGLNNAVWSWTHASCARGYAKSGAFGLGFSESVKSVRKRPTALFEGKWWYVLILNLLGLLVGRKCWLKLRSLVRKHRRKGASDSSILGSI